MPRKNKLENRKYFTKWYKNNKKKQIKRVQENKRKIKKRWKEYKSKQKCNRCSENHISCLDFHHKDPSKKDGLLNEIIKGCSWKRIMKEVSKCEVLCSNCHRKEHWKG